MLFTYVKSFSKSQNYLKTRTIYYSLYLLVLMEVLIWKLNFNFNHTLGTSGLPCKGGEKLIFFPILQFSFVSIRCSAEPAKPLLNFWFRSPLTYRCRVMIWYFTTHSETVQHPKEAGLSLARSPRGRSKAQWELWTMSLSKQVVEVFVTPSSAIWRVHIYIRCVYNSMFTLV